MKLTDKEIYSKELSLGSEFTRLDRSNKYVCSHHFRDFFLNDYIRRNTEGSGYCHYCGSYRQHLINVDNLIDFMRNRVCQYYSDPQIMPLPIESTYYDDDTEIIPGLQRVGGLVALQNNDAYNSTEDLLDYLNGLSDNNFLNEEIIKSFDNEQWLREPGYEIPYEKQISCRWEFFAEKIKKSCNIDIQKEDYNNDPFDIIDILSEALFLTKKKLPKDTIIYRIVGQKQNEKIDSFARMTSAPDEKAVANRMSPKGVSMFYGAFDKETCKAEYISHIDDSGYTIGEFTTKKDVYVIDLRALPPTSFWMDHWETISFLHSFHFSITKKISPEDKNIEYLPSQYIISQIIKKFGAGDEPIKGIIYNSSKVNAANIVLFYNQTESKKILDLESKNSILFGKQENVS